MFVNNNTDNNILNYLAKSGHESDLIKSGLVKKKVQINGEHGTYRADRWVKEGEDQPEPTSPVQREEPKKKPKRAQVPATEHTITDTNKHLLSVSDYSEIPEALHKNCAKTIPKGWRNIMISPDPGADLLCMGKDDQNRTQYIYSKEFTAKQQSEKFNRVKELTGKYDELVDYVTNQLEDKESSDCLRLILATGLRPGSTRDTKSEKEARGATTLKGENIIIEGDQVFLDFTGKKGVHQHHEIKDESLKSMLKARKEQAGYDGDLFNTNDKKLRQALEPFGVHTKDLRTMVASDQARKMLAYVEPPKDVKEFVKVRNQVGDHVCSILGNTRDMSLKSYIDASIFDDWAGPVYKEWLDKPSKGGKSNGKDKE